MRSFFESTSCEPTSDPAVFHGALDETWLQGRTAFGGVVVGAALRCLQTAFADGRAVRSVMTNFAGPVSGAPFDVRVALIRAGRSLTHAQAQVVQDDTIRTVVTAVFGDAREVAFDICRAVPPEMPAPDTLMALPYVPGIAPAFTQHYTYRMEPSSMPFSGAREPDMNAWMHETTRQPGEVFDAPAIAGLMDAPPPPIWTMLNRPAPASTVTWLMNIVAPDLSALDTSWVKYSSRATVVQDGYCDFEGALFDAQGQPIALSRQMVAEFSKPGDAG